MRLHRAYFENSRKRFVAGVFIAGMLVHVAAGETTDGVKSSGKNVVADSEPTPLAAWWNGKSLSGDWFGAKPYVEDRGLTIQGSWAGAYFGILDSENGSGNAFSQHLTFNANLDFFKLTGSRALKGLTAFSEGRWRDPGYDANPNNEVEASSLFNPSRYVGGAGWRLMSFGLSYTTPELFGAEDFLTLTGGWIQPQKEFVEQPLARLFVNNAMASAEGLGGNIPFGSSYSTWGGTIEVKPVVWQYTKAGLFMTFPDATSPGNHGLMFQGLGSDPSQNGLFFMGETGVTPEIGASKLPGRYAFGGYFYGDNTAQTGTDRYAFYWQADQMLFREASTDPDRPSPQGLRVFSLFTLAPNERGITYPFYMQGGLVYEGPIPGRDRDQLIVGTAFGRYSDQTRQNADAKGNPGPETTTLIEAGYRIKLNGWSFVQPFAQYIVQPNGTTAVADAAILGVFLGVDF